MAHAIKVRRAGIERIFRKTVFRQWLEEQSRSKLTYAETISNDTGKGWTLQDFIMEAVTRNLDVRIGTVQKWCQGAKPRYFVMNELTKAFPSIKF